MPGTRSHKSKGKPSFFKRSSTRGSSNNETREVAQQLARAALVYSLKRLTRQDLADKGSTSRQGLRSKFAYEESQPHERDCGTTAKVRDSSRASHRSDRDRNGNRDGNDIHDVIGQLAVGILGFGIRHFLRQRKKKEKEEQNKTKPPLYATTAATQEPPRPSGEYPYTSYADYLAATSNSTGAGTRSRSLPTDGPEPAAISLATTLDSLKKELQATSEALVDLVNKPPSQRKQKDDAHEALAKRAEGIRVLIDNLEMAVNNVRNLHPEIDEHRGVRGGVGKAHDGEGKERSGKEEKEKGKEGEVGKVQGDEHGWGKREGGGRDRERERVRRGRDGTRCSKDRESKPRRSVEFGDELDRYGYSRGSERRYHRR